MSLLYTFENDPNELMPLEQKHVLSNKLTRIWNPERVVLRKRNAFDWLGEIGHGLDLNVSSSDYSIGLHFYLHLKETHYLHCNHFDGVTGSHIPREKNPSPYISDWEKEQDQFVSEWLDRFRRGCWLMGGAVEKTAHEEIEWMFYGREIGVLPSNECAPVVG
jgi:hypothetical protein